MFIGLNFWKPSIIFLAFLLVLIGHGLIDGGIHSKTLMNPTIKISLANFNCKGN